MGEENQQYSQRLSDIRDRFVSLIRQNRVLDSGTGWFHLYRLWSMPDTRAEFASIISTYLDLLFPDKSLIMIIPESAISAYTLLPAAIVAGHEQGRRIAIWSEIGNIVNGSSVLYSGPIPANQECFLLQGVVETGITLLKVLPEIKKVKWKLRAYVVLIQATGDSLDALESSIKDADQDKQATTGDFRYEHLIDPGDI